MAYRKVSGDRKYYKYSECSPNDILVKDGKYLGSEQGKYGIQHLFDVDGQTVVLNSAGHLNHILDKITTGEICIVTYLGKEVLKKGKMAGKEFHRFEVLADDSAVASDPIDAIEFDTAPATPTAPSDTKTMTL